MPGPGHFVGSGLGSSLDGTGDGGDGATAAAARLGASAAFRRGRLRLALPRGFLDRWHRAAIPERPWQRDAPSPAALRRLHHALRTGNDAERLAAAEELRACCQHAAPAVVAAVGDRLAAVRWRAVEILRLVGPPECSLAALATALRSDPCRSVRWRAAEALGALTTPPSRTAAEALIEAAQDVDEWVRWHADRVLSQVVDRALVKSLLPGYATSSAVHAVKAYAIAFLARSDRVDGALLRRLVEELRHPAVAVRRSTIELVSRHPPPPERAMRRALRLSMEDVEPAVRARAVRAMATCGGRGTLLQSALADGDPGVRIAVCEALADSKEDGRTRRRWLCHALGDSRLVVRLAAARALMRLGWVNREVVAVLVQAVAQPAASLVAWRELLALEPPYDSASGKAAGALHPSTLARLIAEDVAAGTLPTVGVRLWPEKAKIRYPNKEGGDRPPLALGYPWVNVGVFHSWESHLAAHRSPMAGITKQVCLAAPPYPHAHLVAVVELARYPPPGFDGRRAPVHIEGWPVGGILEGTIGAGHGETRQPRLDFVFAVDLRFCQYATFAALSDGAHPTPGAGRGPDGLWQAFVARISELLSGYGLGELACEPWFHSPGWSSSRYGVRRERPYDQIRAGVVAFMMLLRSPRGPSLAAELLAAGEDLVEPLERNLWRAKLQSYPLALRRQLAAGELSARCAACLERDLT